MPDLNKKPLSSFDKTQILKQIVDAAFWLGFWLIIATTIILCTYFGAQYQ